jgi:ribonucleotide reductase alpha subunit
MSLNALTVLGKRYLKKDKSGRGGETPEETFYRVAGGWVCDSDMGEVMGNLKPRRRK